MRSIRSTFYQRCGISKDAAFNEWAKKIKEDRRVKYVFVTLPQKSQDLFVKDFITKFHKTEWDKHIHGEAWPK